MEYDVGDLIDNRFKVTDVCSDSGGMGRVLLVDDMDFEFNETLALKYCRDENEENVKRFVREVRLLKQFKGNSKVVNVYFSNVSHDPPYFVMEYYPEGDLTNHISRIQSDPEEQERIFYMMIDCISELHTRNVYHRDIKPQNFLVCDEGLVVTDFGIGLEPDSTTRFTSTTVLWGTHGYLPPEFHSGGFKNADQTGDIFMLGKSFYVLLTGQSPLYLMEGGINPAIFHVVEKACELDKSKRYKSLSELKQALKMAYDVVLGRGGYLSEVSQLYDAIKDKLENEGRYSSSKVLEFVEKLGFVEDDDQIRICLDVNDSFVSLLTNDKLISKIGDFLKIYKKMVESERYGWAFAEQIASNMQIIFETDDVPPKVKGKALELAIDAANRMHRFAAMDTCTAMISSVVDDELATYVVSVIQDNPYSFLLDMELSQCRSEIIREAIRALKSNQK